MPDKDPCALLVGKAREYCEQEDDTPTRPRDEGGLMGGASDHVLDLAQTLIDKITNLIAPGETWAPQKATDTLYAPFLWLGQHMAVAIFICVVVVCALTAWQGAPRLKQMGHSIGWTMVAVAGMASVPGVVLLLTKAVSQAFATLLRSDEKTLFTALLEDLKSGSDAGNPLVLLIVMAALCVALAFALLVFMTRNLGILAFVCLAPVVFASLARGGDSEAVQQWAHRLLGLLFSPLALVLVSPFVSMTKGSLVLDSVLLVAADVVMLRMIFHGVPYIGPRLARAARTVVERQTDNRAVRAVVRAGVPDFHEQEDVPRGPRVVATPGRALGRDGDVLFAAYGLKGRQRPGRLTTDSAIAQAGIDAERQARVLAARREARAAHTPGRTTPRPRTTPAAPAAGSASPSRPTPPAAPSSSPGAGPGGPNTPQQ